MYKYYKMSFLKMKLLYFKTKEIKAEITVYIPFLSSLWILGDTEGSIIEMEVVLL